MASCGLKERLSGTAACARASCVSQVADPCSAQIVVCMAFVQYCLHDLCTWSLACCWLCCFDCCTLCWLIVGGAILLVACILSVDCWWLLALLIIVVIDCRYVVGWLLLAVVVDAVWRWQFF